MEVIMLLRSQTLGVGGSQFQPISDRSITLRRAVVAACVVGGAIALVAFDASATPDKVDIMTGVTALPAGTLKIYSNLMKIVPIATGLAVLLAATKGGMGYIGALVRSVVH